MNEAKQKCEKCGCNIYDPFSGNVLIHDKEKCNGIKNFKYPRPSSYNSNTKL